jgi:hypothetical protein
MIIKKHCLIIGAMKSGTTSLFCTLKDSQDIDASIKKDTKFFIDEKCGGNWHKGSSWYKDQFSNNGTINLEASTHYAKIPDYNGVPDRILKTLRDVKFIYLYRNPIDRAISHFFHNRIVDKEAIDINSALSNIKSKYYNYSNYSKQIIPYLERFDKSKILAINIVDFHQIKLNQILDFIFEQKKNRLSQILQHRNSYSEILEGKQELEPAKTPSNQPVKSNSKIRLAKSVGLKKEVLLKMTDVMQEYYDNFSDLMEIKKVNFSYLYGKYL